MNSVLVGMFDSHADAMSAREQLLAAGFSAGSVSLSGGTAASTTSSATGTTEPHHEGGIAHFFRNLFGDDDSADRSSYSDTYQEAFRRGSYGVSVTAANEIELEKADKILDACGAVDIDERSQQWKNEGWTGGAAATDALAPQAQAGVAAGGRQKLQEIEEELRIGKRTVSRGGVRIFSRMTEVPVQETVSLREEHADVQRRAVDRPATEADFAAFKEGSVEVRDSSEEAVVSKTARVVEEVEIGKEVTQRQETVHDTVRKTKVDVERIEDTATATAATGRGDVYTTGASTGRTGTVGSNNRDPISGEPGAHPVGTAVGATAGGVAAGAAVGSIAGPVGTAVGAAVGAVAGGLAGKGVAEKVDPTVPRKP